MVRGQKLREVCDIWLVSAEFFNALKAKKLGRFVRQGVENGKCRKSAGSAQTAGGLRQCSRSCASAGPGHPRYCVLSGAEGQKFRKRSNHSVLASISDGKKCLKLWKNKSVFSRTCESVTENSAVCDIFAVGLRNPVFDLKLKGCREKPRGRAVVCKLFVLGPLGGGMTRKGIETTLTATRAASKTVCFGRGNDPQGD